MWSILVVLSCIFMVESSSDPLIAPVGGNVTFQCSHFFARGNVKYFCRESCDHVLIQSRTGENPTRRGRYALMDEGSDFIVTVTGLQISDSGTYICAVERYLTDTYTHVTLRVMEEETSMRQSSTDTSPESMHRSGLSNPLLYVGAGLAALVLTFTFAVFTFIKLKQKQRRCWSSRMSSTCQSDYVNYTTPNCTALSDSLHYSSVGFIRKPDGETELTDTLYSSIQTRHQSNITEPNSIIYSSVRERL